MIIQCVNCDKKFNVNSELIPNKGRTIECGSCRYVWFYTPNNLEVFDSSKDTEKLAENKTEAILDSKKDNEVKINLNNKIQSNQKALIKFKKSKKILILSTF